jgi:lipopolysaccharide transport system ATP-binding protein
LQNGSDRNAVIADGVSKRFQRRDRAALFGDDSDSFFALSDVTFSVPWGQTMGIIGQNGSGKSTLLQLLAGVSLPSSGAVIVNGRVCPLLQLGTGFQLQLSGRDNLYLNGSILGLTLEQIDERYESIVEFAELGDAMESPVRHYSSGMQARLGFAIAVHSDPEILLLDEVLAVGDAVFRAKSEERIRAFQAAGVTILVVSHNAQFIADFCDTCLWLHDGKERALGDAQAVVNEYESFVGPRHGESDRARLRPLRRRAR